MPCIQTGALLYTFSAHRLSTLRLGPTLPLVVMAPLISVSFQWVTMEYILRDPLYAFACRHGCESLGVYHRITFQGGRLPISSKVSKEKPFNFSHLHNLQF